MQEFGLSRLGFRRKRYIDIMESMEGRARELFGENINLTERSPLGLFLRIVAWSLGLLWQLAETVYNSAFVDTAEGHDLDKVGLYIGIVRRPAMRATGEVEITGDDDTIIPAGFILETTGGVRFQTTEAATITGGTATVEVIAVDAGTSGNLPAGTITEIVNPAVGIDAVTNPEPTVGGLNRETDAEFRARYALSVAKGGASTIDSIRASLLDVEGVRAAIVIENNTAQAVDGRPPKSFESYLLGGEPEDIASTILQTKAAGIQAYGQESQTVKDAAGQEHVVGFTYAEEVGIEANITVITDEHFRTDGDRQIRTAIVRYIGGRDEDGQVYVGLSMGQTVIYNEVIRRVMQVEGVLNATITINRAGGNPDREDIAIELTEVAEISWGDITLSET